MELWEATHCNAIHGLAYSGANALCKLHPRSSDALILRASLSAYRFGAHLGPPLGAAPPNRFWGRTAEGLRTAVGGIDEGLTRWGKAENCESFGVTSHARMVSFATLTAATK